jgi:signal transduction protein with GAF and PtsI domain
MSAEAKINIETFKAVTKAIARSRNLDIMTNHLTQLLVAALDIKGCAIYFLNPETRELEMLASFGLSTNYLTKGPILADKSIGSDLVGEPVIIPDINKDARLQYPEEAKKEGIAAILTVPIVFLNDVIGALRLYHHEVWNPSEQDLDSLHLLAENVGLAMTYTRLVNAIDSIVEVTRQVLPSP